MSSFSSSEKMQYFFAFIVAVAVIACIVVAIKKSAEKYSVNTSSKLSGKLSGSKKFEIKSPNLNLTVGIENYKKFMASMQCLEKASNVLNQASGYSNSPASMNELARIFENTYNSCMQENGF